MAAAAGAAAGAAPVCACAYARRVDDRGARAAAAISSARIDKFMLTPKREPTWRGFAQCFKCATPDSAESNDFVVRAHARMPVLGAAAR